MLLIVSPVTAEQIGLESLKDDRLNVPAESGQYSASREVWVLNAEQWELAKSGDSILLISPLNKLLNRWLNDKSKKIEVQYPGGEEGEFWVQQVSDWLVALGIPSKQMFLLVGSGADDVIKFSLIKSEILIY